MRSNFESFANHIIFEIVKQALRPNSEEYDFKNLKSHPPKAS